MPAVPYIDVGTRIQALALFEMAVPAGRILEITGVSRSSLYRLKRVAMQRGYDPAASRRLKVEYVVDGMRPGRPGKQAKVKGDAAGGVAGLNVRTGEMVVHAVGVVVEGNEVVRRARVDSEEGEREREREAETGTMGMTMEMEMESMDGEGEGEDEDDGEGDGGSVGTVETRDTRASEDALLSLIEHEVGRAPEEMHEVA